MRPNEPQGRPETRPLKYLPRRSGDPNFAPPPQDDPSDAKFNPKYRQNGQQSTQRHLPPQFTFPFLGLFLGMLLWRPLGYQMFRESTWHKRVES